MSGQVIRDEMHRIIDSWDESKLQIEYNRLMKDETIVGYRANGKPVSLSNLKETVARSQEQYEKGQFTDIDDLIKESETW